jgi:hypothetical protein
VLEGDEASRQDAKTQRHRVKMKNSLYKTGTGKITKSVLLFSATLRLCVKKLADKIK